MIAGTGFLTDIENLISNRNLSGENCPTKFCKGVMGRESLTRHGEGARPAVSRFFFFGLGENDAMIECCNFYASRQVIFIYCQAGVWTPWALKLRMPYCHDTVCLLASSSTNFYYMFPFHCYQHWWIWMGAGKYAWSKSLIWQEGDSRPLKKKKKKKKIEKRTDVIWKIPVYLLWPDLEWSRLSSQSSPIQVLLFYWYARVPESLTKSF